MKHFPKAAQSRAKQWLVSLFSVGMLGVLVVYAMGHSADLFFETSALVAAEPAHRVKLGGMVVPDSIHHGRDLTVQFDITDYQTPLTVHYQGVLPDLFKAGQGIVVSGRYDINTGYFEATDVLAKHDENYQPDYLKGGQQ